MNKLSLQWIFGYAACLHLGWGIMLIVSDSPIHTVGLSPFMNLFDFHLWGIIFIIISVCVGIELKFHWRYSMIGVLLQHIVLTMSAITAAICVINSAYADGVIRSRLFILSDQFPAILMSIIHTVGIVKVYGKRR